MATGLVSGQWEPYVYVRTTSSLLQHYSDAGYTAQKPTPPLLQEAKLFLMVHVVCLPMARGNVKKASTVSPVEEIVPTCQIRKFENLY